MDDRNNFHLTPHGMMPLTAAEMAHVERTLHRWRSSSAAQRLEQAVVLHERVITGKSTNRQRQVNAWLAFQMLVDAPWEVLGDRADEIRKLAAPDLMHNIACGIPCKLIRPDRQTRMTTTTFAEDGGRDIVIEETLEYYEAQGIDRADLLSAEELTLAELPPDVSLDEVARAIVMQFVDEWNRLGPMSKIEAAWALERRVLKRRRGSVLDLHLPAEAWAAYLQLGRVRGSEASRAMVEKIGRGGGTADVEPHQRGERRRPNGSRRTRNEVLQ